ncbi:MAG: SRPBCC domain-containing protein [Gemmatimonadaceae bacterium]
METTAPSTRTLNLADKSPKTMYANAVVADHYHCEIAAPVTAAEAFDKITRVGEWWVTKFEGRARALNDVFTVRFGGESFVTFRVTGVVPNVEAVWTVTDCYLGMLKDRTEWTGTTVVWMITESDRETRIQFAHVGIMPAVECYEMCVKGWDQYVKGSLFQLLTENMGQPS